MRLYRLLLVVVISLAVLPRAAAEGKMSDYWHGITRADGLSGGSVSTFCEGHDGQMWIGSTGGVNLYNGQRMVAFSLREKEDELNRVRVIAETADHLVYAITDNGLFYIRPGEAAFTHICPGIEAPQWLEAVGDTVYVGDKNGMTIVCRGRKAGMVTVSKVNNIIESQIRGISRCEDGTLLLMSRYFFSRYDPKRGKVVKRYEVAPQLPPKTNLGQAVQWRDRVYFTSLMRGLFCLDLKTGRVTHVEGIGNVLRNLNTDYKGRLFIASDNAGAYVYDCDSCKVTKHYCKEATGDSRLPTNAIRCFYRDSHGVDWIGFAREGLVHSWKDNHFFRPYRFKDFTTEGKFVWRFYRHGRQLLIGTDDGFYFIDEARGIARHYDSAALSGASNVGHFIYYNGKYYIGTWDSGLFVLNAATLAIEPLYRQDNYLAHSGIGGMAVAPDGKLWISTSSGLFIFNADGTFRMLTMDNSKLTGYMAYEIVFDSNGNGWLGMDHGLCVWLKDQDRFVDNDFPDGFPNKLELVCYPGYRDKVFMVSKLHVYYSNLSMTRFGELKLPRSVYDESMHYIVEDGRHNLWVSTEKGLFRMDGTGPQFIHFGAGDGLNSNFCPQIAIDGHRHLWVASSEGLMYADLSRLGQWEKNGDYRTIIYNVRLGGVAKPSMSDKRVIHLSWNITSSPFSFSMTLPDYSKPAERYYEYRLDDGRWVTATEGEEIPVGGLLLGKHSLAVRLAGMPGSESLYTIYVSPSWLAIAELLLLIAAIAAFVLWRRYRANTMVMLDEKKEMEEALVELNDEQHAIEEKEDEAKYKGVKLDDKECEDIVRRMREYLEKEHAYRNPDLKRADIAGALHVPVAKLSQIFTLYLKENYYDFVNRYRLDEFKRMVADGESARYTITALSERCGFKRSNFFSTFRKVEGMTPAEYLKKVEG